MKSNADSVSKTTTIACKVIFNNKFGILMSGLLVRQHLADFKTSPYSPLKMLIKRDCLALFLHAVPGQWVKLFGSTTPHWLH